MIEQSPPKRSSPAPGTAPALLVFLAAFLFFAIVAPMGNIPSDTEYSVATAQSLFYTHSLSIQRTSHFWAAVETKSGEYHSKYGIGYALSFLPQVAVSYIVSRVTHVNGDYVLKALLSFTNTLYAAAIAAMFFLLFFRLGYAPVVSVLTTFLICFASILLPFSKIVHAEVPTALFLLLFLYMTARPALLDVRRGIFLGVIASALYLLKPGNIPLSCFVGCYAGFLVIKKQATVGGIVSFLVSAGLPMAGLLAMNQYYFGSPFNFGYGGEQRRFTTPLWQGLAGLLFSPSKSVFVFSPLLVAACVSIPRQLKRNPVFTISTLALMAVSLVFFACWYDWSGGWCWGPRLVVPAMIIGHVFLAEFLVTLGTSRVKRALFVLLVCAGLLVNLLGSLVWYQQIYYFHKDYTSVNHSHIAIASQLFVHKLQEKPELYHGDNFGIDFTRGSHHVSWDAIVRGNDIDFTSFESYQGFSTMWTGLSRVFGWTWALTIPFFLLAGAVLCGFLAFKKCGGSQ